MPLTKDEAVSRARELAPAIADRAYECEKLRKPHDDSIKELVDADLMGLMVPKRYGGHELGLDAMTEVVYEISRACMSTGWIAAFYIGHNWLVPRMSKKFQDEIFADKNYGLIPGSTVPTLKVETVEGGYKVSGRAAWGSGIMHADWVLMCGVREDGIPMMFLLPIEDVEVIDVWFMTGMSGTGSNDMACNDAFVPEHRAVSMIDFGEGNTEGAKLYDNPLYTTLPLMPFVYCETMGVFAGGLRGAADAFDATIKSRVRVHTGSSPKDNQYSHVILGEAHTNAEMAYTLAMSQASTTAALLEHGPFSMEDRLRLKAHAGFLVNLCRSSVNELVAHSSASIFNEKLPLQRFFRDMGMLTTHAFFEWDNAREQFGRAMLGLEPNHPLV